MHDWREKINAWQAIANFSHFLPSTFPVTYHQIPEFAPFFNRLNFNEKRGFWKLHCVILTLNGVLNKQDMLETYDSYILTEIKV